MSYLEDKVEEIEWYSNCCNAPPLYELHDSSEYILGMCMKCREGAVFSAGIEDDSYE